MQPKQKSLPLWAGTGWHFLLEDWHGSNLYGNHHECWDDYVRATVDYYELENMPDDLDETIKLFHNMIDYYQDWLVGRDPYKTFVFEGVPQTEVNFKIQIPVNNKYEYDVVYYQGTIDRVIEDEYGNLWIAEYKTAKQIFKAHFLTDPQVTAYCVPLDTEILTRTGWKQYSQLTIGEEVLGYNQEADKLEWTILEAIHTPGVQSTITVSTKSMEFVTTPDHKWAKVVRHKGASYKKEKKYSKVLEDIYAHRDNSYVVAASKLNVPTLEITPSEAAVIAWLLTDSSYGTYNRGDRASICQSHKKYANEVQKLLDQFERAYTRIQEREDCCIWHLSMDFFHSLWKKAGIDIELNGWENFILGMSLEAREAFCHHALLAEGSNNDTFYQNKGRKQDIFKLAFFLCGYFPTISKPSGGGDSGFKNSGLCEKFTVGTPYKWSKTIQVDKNVDQQVWCPQTKLRTWIMRQNGQMIITGNCWAAQALYGRPIVGCIYCQWHKKVPDEPKFLRSGTLSIAQNQSTTHRLYRKALIKIYGSVNNSPKPNVDYLNMLAAQETADDDGYISRERIHRNSRSLEMEGVKILMEVDEMLNPNTYLFPNPARDNCHPKMCSFRDVCIAYDNGDDWENILDLDFEHKMEERGRDPWRQYLKHKMEPKVMLLEDLIISPPQHLP